MLTQFELLSYHSVYVARQTFIQVQPRIEAVDTYKHNPMRLLVIRAGPPSAYKSVRPSVCLPICLFADYKYTYLASRLARHHCRCSGFRRSFCKNNVRRLRRRCRHHVHRVESVRMSVCLTGWPRAQIFLRLITKKTKVETTTKKKKKRQNRSRKKLNKFVCARLFFLVRILFCISCLPFPTFLRLQTFRFRLRCVSECHQFIGVRSCLLLQAQHKSCERFFVVPQVFKHILHQNIHRKKLFGKF